MKTLCKNLNGIGLHRQRRWLQQRQPFDHSFASREIEKLQTAAERLFNLRVNDSHAVVGFGFVTVNMNFSSIHSTPTKMDE